MKKYLLLKVFAALLVMQSFAVAQGVCESVNRIVDSGINNDFAAVAGLYLPNASECAATRSEYQCTWGDRVSIDNYIEFSEEFSRQRSSAFAELRRQSRLLRRDDYNRLRRETEELIGTTRRSRDSLKESFVSEAKRESGNLYQSVYGCFQAGAITDSTAYVLTDDSDEDENDWTWRNPRGCRIEISSDLDTRLRIRC